MTKKTIYFIIKLSTRGNYAYYLFAEKPEREKRKEIIFMRKIIKALLVVLVLAMALTALAACDLFPIREPEVTEPTPCEHKGGAATCTEAAICEICGESYGEALGHDMSEATCTEAAACKREGCDYTEGKALGHKNGFTASVQPTCTEEGISSSQYCTVCQEVFVEAIVIPAKGHAWVDATCTNPKTCDVCGETEGDPIAHTWTDVEGKAPTCTEPGYTAHKVCTCKATEGKEVLDATGHNWTDATCTSAKTCGACGATEGEALGHTGYEEDFVCDVCSAVVEPAADSTLTLEQANALGVLVTQTTNKYYVTGTVTNINNTFYGNIYINNGTTSFYIYGTKSADGSVAFDKLETKPYVGDTVIMYGYLSNYQGSAQMKDAWMTSCVHEHVYSEPTCQKAATCVCGLTQGDLGDHDYKDGLCTVCSAVDPDFEGEITVTVGKADFETMGAASGSYATRTSTNGWVATNAALLTGGTADQNPKFIFLGDSSTRAVTLNGKTSAKGKLTSPTLTGGISKLTFKYGHAFSESNGVDVTINIIQNGAVVASYHLDVNSITQKTAYDFTWTLEEEVTGDFTIEIVNNSPTNSTSNKDRISIWDLEWVSN